MSLRMIFARAVVWTAILCSGCVCMKEKPTERDLAALREMAFDAMRDRIGKLADDRSINCRKELWPWKAHSLDWEGVDLDRFHVVKVDEDPPDDGLFGNELVDSLRKCTTGDAVPFASISNRIVNTFGLAWFGKDGSSLAGMARHHV